jgi:CHAD domain-containing protein
MDKFASAQASRLLGKLAFRVRQAIRHPNEEAVHDLRVSIRRLSLREFRQFFPRHHTKKILKQLDKVMDMAAGMRNRDVATELIGADLRAAKSALIANLRREREKGHAEADQGPGPMEAS